MKRDIAIEWVKALRSGKYNQIQGCLRNDKGFCCLGVLSELAVDAGIIEEAKKDKLSGIYTYETVGTMVLLHKVRNWAGMKFAAGSTTNQDGEMEDISLSEMNDNGKTFLEIADFIEKEYERL